MLELIQALLEWIEKYVDLTEYQPRGNHPFNRLSALQRMLVDIQNISVVRRDKTREELTKRSHFLARTYEELRCQKEVFAQLILALERGGGKAKGDVEGEIMGAFVRIQLGQGH